MSKKKKTDDNDEDKKEEEDSGDEDTKKSAGGEEAAVDADMLDESLEEEAPHILDEETADVDVLEPRTTGDDDADDVIKAIEESPDFEDMN